MPIYRPFDGLKLAYEFEQKFEWRKWKDELPWLNFPTEWEVKILPPFCAAIIRFWVRLKDNPSNQCSVYFDGYDQLGFVGKPYWELYNGEDTERFLLGQEDQLMAAIAKNLKREAP